VVTFRMPLSLERPSLSRICSIFDS
jgi:hypothetical protein